MKHRNKYEKKMKNIKGGQRAVSDRSGAYKGETSGIKSNVTHSTKLA